LFASTPFIAEFYNEKALLHIVPILGINVLLIAAGRQHRTILQKEFRFKRITIVELSAFLTGLIVAIILVYKGFGVYSLIYSTLVKSAISNTLFVGINYQLNPIKLHFSFQDTREFLRVGGYQMGSSLLGFFSKEVDILIIGRLLGAEALGLYSLSKQIVLKLYSLINPIVTTVLSPMLSSIQEEKHRLKKIYLKIVRYLAYINFLIYLIVIIASKEILFFVYGATYVEGYIVLSLLAVFYCISALSNPVGSLQVATGRTDLGFVWTILRLFITPLFIYVGALYGINGVGIAHALLATLLIVPMWYIQLRPMADISLLEYFQQFYKPLMIFFTIGSGFLIWNVFLMSEISFLVFLFKILLSFLVFTIILALIDKVSLKEFYKFGYTFFKKI
jgi:O-antigen/teichoic acid export membrane protein